MEGRLRLENPLRSIQWIEKNDVLNHLLHQEGIITTHPMEQGFEAEVIKLHSDQGSFVLKVWNKSSRPNISFQYSLLNALFDCGLPVSKPVGFGKYQNADYVLLTTFDGAPITKVNKMKLTDIAMILSKIHTTPVEELGPIQLPTYDFKDYFYPGIQNHSDLDKAFTQLAGMTSIKQERVIHGDYHLRNILEQNEQLTVIDWTNGQYGDPRYDFAWSLVLKKIYLSERNASVFSSAYLLQNDIRSDELAVFEAMACLRWILLHRNGGTPIEPNTLKKVRRLIHENPNLKELEFYDIP